MHNYNCTVQYRCLFYLSHSNCSSASCLFVARFSSNSLSWTSSTLPAISKLVSANQNKVQLMTCILGCCMRECDDVVKSFRLYDPGEFTERSPNGRVHAGGCGVCVYVRTCVCVCGGGWWATLEKWNHCNKRVVVWHRSLTHTSARWGRIFALCSV